jgi:hypothetical protein
MCKVQLNSIWWVSINEVMNKQNDQSVKKVQLWNVIVNNGPKRFMILAMDAVVVKSSVVITWFHKMFSIEWRYSENVGRCWRISKNGQHNGINASAATARTSSSESFKLTNTNTKRSKVIWIHFLFKSSAWYQTVYPLMRRGKTRGTNSERRSTRVIKTYLIPKYPL